MAEGAETGNRHVFALDNLAVERKIAIAGVRALGYPPRLTARGPKTTSFRREHEQS
jgi:hypothetical protein